MSLRHHLHIFKRTALSKSSGRFARDLAHAATLSSAELAVLNWKRRVAIVENAFSCSPIYRRKYRGVGFNPGDLKTERDFQQLPPLERDEVSEYFSEIISENAPRSAMRISATGGTSGTPLKIVADGRVPLEQISWRTLTRWGGSPADNSGYLYRAVPTGLSKVLRQVYLFPTQRRYLSALDMTQPRMRTFFSDLEKIRPTYLVGYVGALEIFANFLEAHSLSLPSLRFVWSTAAPLTTNSRATLEQIFGCPVYSQYGSCEFYWIAAECNERVGLHVDSDIRHVEFVTHNNALASNDAHGDILVTDLVNTLFPLIRYRLGDRGRYLTAKCGCGSPFPLIDYIRGRTADSITLPNGDRVPGEFWTTIFDDYVQQIRNFLVHQYRDGGITVHFEPRDVAWEAAIRQVEGRLKNRLGHDIPLRFVQGVPSTFDRGKMRYVISEVPHAPSSR